MKPQTIRFAIGLTILMAIQTALGFYNPQTGRWLSRDPIEEKGGFNLYTLTSNDAINHADMFGLRTWHQVNQALKRLNDKISNISCCCCKIARVAFDITGTASGDVVTGQAIPNFTGCVDHVFSYFWWSCYDAVKEGGNNSRNQGWSAGGSTFSYRAEPGWWYRWIGINWPFDPKHITINSAAIVIVCENGHKHAKLVGARNELTWAWGDSHWVDPPETE